MRLPRKEKTHDISEAERKRLEEARKRTRERRSVLKNAEKK